MGALMGVAGAPYPFFVTFVEPLSAFSLLIAVNAIAMPMIGGTATWFGPIVGAILLGAWLFLRTPATPLASVAALDSLLEGEPVVLEFFGNT